MSKKNLIAGQSGGPTAAINSSLYGVVSEALKHTEEIDHVYGMVNGIEGFLNGTVLDFQEALPGEQLLALTWTPGAYLGSCRYKLPESLEDPVYPKLFQKFEEMNIGWFFYIGGNDSMDTVSKLSRYAEKIGSDIRILGEPKTIDNDIWGTDTTFGFQSAVDVATNVIDYIHFTASSHSRVFVVELMGRDAGWLTLHAGIGSGADIILIPEIPYDINAILKAVDHRRRHGRSGQQGAKAGLFGWEALQCIAEAARQQGICPAEEHQREACPAGPQRKAGTSQHQRPAPGQKCRAEPAGPEPSGGHGRPHGAEQAEAVQ